MKKFSLLLMLAAVAACKMSNKSSQPPFNAYQYQTQKNVLAENGAVVSAHPLASLAGLTEVNNFFQEPMTLAIQKRRKKH